MTAARRLKDNYPTSMISIIIPAFNEERRIRSSLEKLSSFLKTREEKYETIVVDDASTDNTKKVAEDFKKKIPNLRIIRLDKSPYAGKGLAVNTGALAARGDIVIFTDADFSTPINQIDKLLNKLKEGYDIAIGSRALDRSLVKTRQNPLRELMGRIFNILVRALVIRGIVDTQCGFKAFKMPPSKSLFEQEKIFDFGFDVEILYLARKNNLKIAEVPVIWFNNPVSKVHPIIDSYRMFADLIKIRLYYSNKEGSLGDKFFYLIYHYRTFWRFSVVGTSNTVVDYGLFYILTRMAHLDALTANPISVEIAIIWSFIWNNLWTFSERKVDKPLFNRFFIFNFVSIGALMLSQIGLLLLNKYVGVYDLLAKALTIPIVLLFNYFLNSRWTFRDTAKGRALWYIYTGLILALLLFYLTLTY